MNKACALSAWIVGAIILGGCQTKPLMPTVQVTAPPDKSAEAFQQDRTACTSAAQTQADGSATRGSGAAAREVQQRQFDDTYAHCMYDKGNLVDGMAPPAPLSLSPTARPAPSGPRYDPLIAHVQAELIRLGLLNGKADGFYGPRTRGAILDYEKLRSLPRDGIATRKLLADLKQN